MSEVVEKRFYVLRAMSGKEDKVRERIEAEMVQTDLGNYVSRVLVPKEKVLTQRSNGKKVAVERPLMPGYVLVEAVLVGDVAFRLRSTMEVLGFLANSAGDPVPMRQSEVERLLRRADQMAESEGEYEVELLVGDLVKVTDGAFAGYEAVVESISPEKHKLSVAVKMFGRKMSLELNYAQVTKE